MTSLLPNNVGAGHVLGRYQLLVPIAAGGMAMVWAARLQGTRGFQRTVALKMMLPALSAEPEFEEMFLNEATIASRIRHDNVVQILDLGEDGNLLYLVMEWIDGEPLSAVLSLAAKSQVPIPAPVAVRLTMQMCAGLHAAHELRDDAGELYGVVHRDVSPQNVLVTYDGTAKVVDFGIARMMREESLTHEGTVKGKAPYMAPEQAEGGRVDRRTDIFAAGILLYRMTTGRHPFRGTTNAESLAKLRSKTPFVPPRDLVAGYPRALEDAVMQALARDPDERFGTAKEMFQALDVALPPAMRTTTGEPVATFMHSLFFDAQHRRRQELMQAARSVDEAGAVPMRVGGARGPTTFTSSQLLSEFQRFRAERDEGSESSSNASSHVQPIAKLAELPVVRLPRGRIPPLWIAAVAAVAIAGLVGLAIALSRPQSVQNAPVPLPVLPASSIVEIPDIQRPRPEPQPSGSTEPALHSQLPASPPTPAIPGHATSHPKAQPPSPPPTSSPIQSPGF